MLRHTTPVLLCIYNRPDTTARVVEALRAVQPPVIFIAADGERSVQDGVHCQAARDIALAGIDWHCEVTTDFSAENLGNRRRISSAITWVFEHVESAIILEDDCVPHPTFFSFCAELLERYADEPRLMMISGTNPLLTWPDSDSPQSYHYSHWGVAWGWATWRRAWALYDNQLSALNEPFTLERIRGVIADDAIFAANLRAWQQVRDAEIDTWDYQWSLSMLAQRGLVAVPSLNLVSNIGFGHDATHTTNPLALGAQLPVTALNFPLTHPDVLQTDAAYDRVYSRWHHGQPDAETVLKHARRALADGHAARALLLLRALTTFCADESPNPAVINLEAEALQRLRQSHVR